ncbi:MAG: hypothetical protein ACLQVG_23165 [Terriglobia bacterium]
MKMPKFPTMSALAIGVMLAAATGAQAAEDHLVNLQHPMVVAGVDLRPGLYNIHWNLQGTRATVTFSRKGRIVATVQGVVSTLDKIATHNTVFISKHPEGFTAINAIGFAGSNKDVTFPAYPSRQDPPLDIQMQTDRWMLGPGSSTPAPGRALISK